MRVAMIGAGYVGLVSAACFSEFGVDVTCVDKDTDKIAGLDRGEIPIFEPGLADLVSSNVSGGRLTSLIVYTAFVLYSGGLAAYYLFVSPETRWSRA